MNHAKKTTTPVGLGASLVHRTHRLLALLGFVSKRRWVTGWLGQSEAPPQNRSTCGVAPATSFCVLGQSLVGAAAICGIAVAAWAGESRAVAVQSPNGRFAAALYVSGEDGVRFAISDRQRPFIESSKVDVRLARIGPLGAGATLIDVAREDVDQSSALVWGKTSRIRNRYRGMTVRLKGAHDVEWDMEVRAFDNGVALRYGIPHQPALRDFAIVEENIEFRLTGDPTVLYTTCENYTTSHEALYERKLLSELPAKTLFDKPLLAVWTDGQAAAITEAGLRNFAGMYLERADEPAGALRTRLSPLPGNPKILVEAKTPHRSPWRVMLLADTAGKLIESNVLLCLNEPARGDFAWLKPGKTTFHWWNGTVENGPPSTPETNFATHKKYIDFCAKHHIEYHSVISVAGSRPWFRQREPGFAAPHADTDILTPRPDIDLPRILEYAREKGVGIRFWVHWKPLSEHLEEAFALYEHWGIRGLMVDFMDRDDQEMVAWQEKCLEAAARHKLHVQFHGSYKPTGEQRTYPNLFNREGVLNLEYLKWSDLCTPAHAVNVAYTRALAGPVDYHLGGFRAANREEFEARDLMPSVLGTRCHMLALYVVYENPMPMVADDPEAYEGQPGFEFVAEVPTTWDETRFVMGEAGEYIVVARRSGDAWYVGGITNRSAREIAMPLDFLGDGQYDAVLYIDRTSVGEDPNRLEVKRRIVTAQENLGVSLSSGGGVAAVFRPK
jgi:alpha-glucosidase